MFTRQRPFQIPLHWRLTIWYTLSLGLILLLFSVFLYVQVRRSLIAQVDAALNLAASQALIGVSEIEGQLAFQTGAQNPEALHKLQDDFIIYLIDHDGEIVEILSTDDERPLFSDQPEGFKTHDNEDEPWRVYRQPFQFESASGWIQAAQELDPVMTTLSNLQIQIIWGLPLALLLAGIGGYVMAAHSLRPIDHITQTAQAITATDLAQRLHYQGPADEVGRLAQTFDTMLDRLQTAFVRERRFTGDAAHELRTPLAALKGRLGVTLSQLRSPAVYQETLQDMEGQVDRLIRLSNDLLFMARLDQSQFQLQRERIALADLLGAVGDQIRPLADTKHITLDENIPDGLTVSGDLDLLIRLFLNLLDNAIKYTVENGRIIIAAQQTGTKASIVITDTGPGIPAEHLPHLFERFYRVEEDRGRHSQNHHKGGAGLGLAIAYEIARTHGGIITVRSELGKGTSFIVQLPQDTKVSKSNYGSNST